MRISAEQARNWPELWHSHMGCAARSSRLLESQRYRFLCWLMVVWVASSGWGCMRNSEASDDGGYRRLMGGTLFAFFRWWLMQVGCILLRGLACVLNNHLVEPVSFVLLAWLSCRLLNWAIPLPRLNSQLYESYDKQKRDRFVACAPRLVCN